MIRITLLLIPLLCACKPNAQPSTTELAYENKTISSTKEDDLSPTGFWETAIDYPAILGSSVAIQKINEDIYKTAIEYQCDDGSGDKQFKAEVTLLNNKMISLKYTDSWYCAGMPNSQGRTGALTYELKNGKKIEFLDQLEKSKTGKLMEKISSGLDQALIEKQVNEECPSPSMGYFYSSDTKITLVNKSDSIEAPQCEVEYEISFNEIKEYLKDDSILR